MAFNPKSITPAHLAELLQDGAVKTMKESFIASRLIKDKYTKQVTRKAGTADLAHISLLTPDKRAIEAAAVSEYADTPILRNKMAKLDYECVELRTASALPQSLYVSADAAMADLVELLIHGAGVTVKSAAELQLINILDGTSGSTTENLTGKAWNSYSDPDSDPIRDLLKARRMGCDIAVLGENVVAAALEHPKFTGSDAGSGTHVITEGELVNKIQGLGYKEVWFGNNAWVRGAGLNQAGTLTQLHDGVLACFKDGAIVRLVQREFEFDEYDDKNKDARMFRAKETSVIKSANPESILAFTNVLA